MHLALDDYALTSSQAVRVCFYAVIFREPCNNLQGTQMGILSILSRSCSKTR